MPFYLGGRLVWDSHVGKYLPSTGELCFLLTSGSWSVLPEDVGEEVVRSRGFLVLRFQIPVTWGRGRAVGRREILLVRSVV